MIILASGSPRRQELLQQLGISFRQQVADIDENSRDNESAADYVARLALEKARAVRSRLGDDEVPVLGADTSVVVEGNVLGKPCDRAHARKMLQLLSGRRHQVFTAVALVGTREEVRVNESYVWFRTLSAKEIDDYWGTGEPQDKAGAYAIQGVGAIFVQRLEGSYSGVMGLPLYETAQLLQNFGIQILDRR